MVKLVVGYGTPDDPGALQAAMATEEGQAASADVANFASGGAQLMIAQA